MMRRVIASSVGGVLYIEWISSTLTRSGKMTSL